MFGSIGKVLGGLVGKAGNLFSKIEIYVRKGLYYVSKLHFFFCHILTIAMIWHYGLGKWFYIIPAIGIVASAIDLFSKKMKVSKKMKKAFRFLNVILVVSSYLVLAYAIRQEIYQIYKGRGAFWNFFCNCPAQVSKWSYILCLLKTLVIPVSLAINIFSFFKSQNERKVENDNVNVKFFVNDDPTVIKETPEALYFPYQNLLQMVINYLVTGNKLVFVNTLVEVANDMNKKKKKSKNFIIVSIVFSLLVFVILSSRAINENLDIMKSGLAQGVAQYTPQTV